MVITWYGQACFRIQSGDLTIAIDPYVKDIGLTPPRFQTNLVLVTHAHHDHSNVTALGGRPTKSGEPRPEEAGEPFVISSPGEYEVRGVYVHGIETYHDAVQGKERGMNTIYTLDVEGVRIAHLGDFGEGELRNETLEKLGNVDVLLIPVGGTYTIDAKEAAKIIKQVEPRYVIPMHYKIPGVKANLAGVDEFLKEAGAAKTEPQDRLTVKKKDVVDEDEKTEIVVLKKV